MISSKYSFQKVKKNFKLNDQLSLLVVLISRSSGCKASPIVRDKIACPQPTKSLIADNSVVTIQIRHDLLEIGSSLCFGGIPEPELQPCISVVLYLEEIGNEREEGAYLPNHDRQPLKLRMLCLQSRYIVLDIRFQS